MLKDFPQGGAQTRAFLAEDFVTRWVLYGDVLPTPLSAKCRTCHGEGYVVEIVGQSWADPYGEPVQQDCPECGPVAAT